MGKKAGTNDAGRTRPGRYYDPAKNRGRHKPVESHVPARPGPTLNNRHHRRERREMPFLNQLELARKMGFPIPGGSAESVMNEYNWIKKWESLYAKQ